MGRKDYEGIKISSWDTFQNKVKSLKFGNIL